LREARTSCAIDNSFLSVWRQALVEQKKIVTVGNSTFAVWRTAKHRLAQIDFEVDGLEFRGLEQNSQTKSRWAKMAREGAKVMQFLQAGRYVGVVADRRRLSLSPAFLNYSLNVPTRN
jgi:hypothetical protein